MSEYQYYEFQAVDRPLTAGELEVVRSCSSRATITATRFMNHYNYGSFKGNPAAWMEKYFDAFVHVANWGSHELSFRLPRRILSLETAKLYCRGQEASARAKGDFVILDFEALDDEGGDWDDDGSGWLSSLLPLRADLADGDHRVLYLAWLLGVQGNELADEAPEPPVPAGLGELSAPLAALVDFLRLDGDLVTAAAARSAALDTSGARGELERWIAALPDGDKTDWLLRLAEGREPHLRAELLRRFRDARPAREVEGPRTVGELREAAGERAAERRRQEAEQAARERARREREEAAVRERHLESLAQREAWAWNRVSALIATKNPARYDEAGKLLVDLRDVGLRQGRAAEVEIRLRGLLEEHAKKPTFLERLRKAGLAKLEA